MNYIIGAGPSASIIKEFLDCKCIAPRTGVEPPIKCLWSTKYTRAYMKNQKGKIIEKTVRFQIEGNNYKKYNELTLKPNGSVPSDGMNGAIKVLHMRIPQTKIDIVDRVHGITEDSLMMHFGIIRLNPEDRVFVASPITFKINGIPPYKYVRYSPVTVFTIKSPKELVGAKYNYKYLLKNKYLENGIYRVTRISEEIYELESKKLVSNQLLSKIFETDIEILDNYQLKFANFKKLKKFNFPGKFIPIARTSRLETDFLLSDIFQVLEELR